MAFLSLLSRQQSLDDVCGDVLKKEGQVCSYSMTKSYSVKRNSMLFNLIIIMSVDKL